MQTCPFGSHNLLTPIMERAHRDAKKTAQISRCSFEMVSNVASLVDFLNGSSDRKRIDINYILPCLGGRTYIYYSAEIPLCQRRVLIKSFLFLPSSLGCLPTSLILN